MKSKAIIIQNKKQNFLYQVNKHQHYILNNSTFFYLFI